MQTGLYIENITIGNFEDLQNVRYESLWFKDNGIPMIIIKFRSKVAFKDTRIKWLMNIFKRVNND